MDANPTTDPQTAPVDAVAGGLAHRFGGDAVPTLREALYVEEVSNAFLVAMPLLPPPGAEDPCVA